MSQRVFRLPSKGAGYEAIEEKTEGIPKVQPHEVLIQIRATTLNYRGMKRDSEGEKKFADAWEDIVVANGQYPFPVKDNVVPLSDAAGSITEIGSDVTGFEKGENLLIM